MVGKVRVVTLIVGTPIADEFAIRSECNSALLLGFDEQCRLSNTGDASFLTLHLDDETKLSEGNRERTNVGHAMRLAWNLKSHPNASNARHGRKAELDHLHLLIADAAT